MDVSYCQETSVDSYEYIAGAVLVEVESNSIYFLYRMQSMLRLATMCKIQIDKSSIHPALNALETRVQNQ